MSITISKIQHPTDEHVNRIQDKLVAQLNPVLKRITAKTTVTGSHGGNAALQSLISALVAAGIIKDSTTP